MKLLSIVVYANLQREKQTGKSGGHMYQTGLGAQVSRPSHHAGTERVAIYAESVQ